MSSVDIKLLNTVLSGCEYSVNDNNLFIIIDKVWLSENKGLDIPDDAILIPSEKDDVCNFAIKYPESENSPYKLVIFNKNSELDEQEIEINFNQVYTVGCVKLVIKLSTDEWQYQLTEDLEQSKEQFFDLVKNIFLKNERNVKKYIISIFCLFICLCVFFFWYGYTEPKRRMVDVASLFQMDSQIKVILGSDKEVYVLGNDEKTVNLILSALKKSSTRLINSVMVVNVTQEKKDISSWINKNWYKVKLNVLNLDDIESPIIYLSKQRSSSLTYEEKNNLIAALKIEKPYIKNIRFEFQDDNVLVERAAYGLKQLNLNYHREINKLYSSFIIQGEIDDADLYNLKTFITEYQKQWGNNYIKFIIQLNDDFFKKFSFKKGEQNYIRLSNNHWYITFN